MNKKFISFIEKMGYKVDYSDNIDDIKIYENGNSLQSLIFSEGKVFYSHNEISFLFNRDGSNYIRAGEYNVITVHDMNQTLKNKRHDYTNIIMDILNSDTEINFGININRNTGLSYIVVSIYNKIKNKCFGSIKFEQSAHTVYVFFNGALNTDKCINIDDDIRSKIMENIFHFFKYVFGSKYDKYVKKGIDAITPALEVYIDQIVSLWRKNLNKYINYYKDLRDSSTNQEDINVLNTMIRETENKRGVK